VSNPLNVVYEFVAWVLKQIYGFLSPIFGPSSGWTWALSIVILVVLMRLILVPLFIKQMHTTRAMTALAPEMSALRKKYKDDKQTLNQEMMKLYQQAGVNPLMGCLPVVLQLPLFFALFSVLRAIAEWTHGAPKYGLTLEMVQSAQKAKILGAGIGDKVLFTDGVNVPLHAKLVILVAVIISMTTTYLTIRQSMKRGMMPAATSDNPMGQTQKYMQYFMPLFALSGLYWQFGLVLYWVTTNVWTLGQQYVLFRRYPQPKAAGAAATATAGGTATAPTLVGRGGAARRTSSTQAGSTQAGANGGSTRRGGGSGSAQGVQDGRGSGSARRTSGTQRQGQVEAPASASPAVNGGGILRKLGSRKTEPEPPPAEPEVKIVRQQRQRQSRSKRTGKR
jgi:YidC/Oxa1 family membrane protein insertase